MNDKIYNDPNRRHDFVLLFDVENGNPNGDPDAGNLPRIDPETKRGIVTDVCLKHKVREYLSVTKNIPMFIQGETALNRLISDSAAEVGVKQPRCALDDEEVIEWFRTEMPESYELDDNTVTYTGESRREKNMKKPLKNVKKDELKRKLNDVVKKLRESVNRDILTTEDRKNTQNKMLEKYYDIRMFGAVLSTGLNAGQVRGPAQLTFAKSKDPIFRNDISIIRDAVTKEEDKKRKENEMARKPVVHYALYVAHGFYNPYFSTDKLSPEDLANLWEALEWMFNNDTAAARGKMATRGLYIFTHGNKRGNAPWHNLFSRISIEKSKNTSDKKDYVPRSFSDYKVNIDECGLEKAEKLRENGIALTKLVHDGKSN